MIAAIMQPTYLPWMGYFDMIDQADVFVLLDNVQFAKRSWQQRNRIKTREGLAWLTVPVLVSGRYHQLIRDVDIQDTSFVARHVLTVRANYARAAQFTEVEEGFEQALAQSVRERRLFGVNREMIGYFCAVLGISKPLVLASDFGIDGKRTGLLASVCAAVGATTYLSAAGSADYLLSEIGEFACRGINVVFHHYEHPEYNQLFPPFLPYASVLDLVMNEGNRSLAIMRSGRRASLSAADMAVLPKGGSPLANDQRCEGSEAPQ